MAPINLPDGTEVSEIVLPDGTTASEVLAPDESTVFGNAIPDPVIDSFEDGDISEYGGDTGAFTVVSSDATDGSQALKLSNATTGGAGSFDGISAVTGLNSTPHRGDIVRFDIKITQALNNEFTTAVGTQNNTVGTNCYTITIDGNGDEFVLGKDSTNSPNTTLKSESLASISVGQQLILEFEWGSDGTLTSRILDASENVLNELSASDSAYDSGGIGFGHNQKDGSPIAIWDYARIYKFNAV